MSSELNRRNFLRTIGAAGLGSVLASKANADSNEPNSTAKQGETPQVPTRKFGKSGPDVPLLSLGAIQLGLENSIILMSSLKWGINYWDTAPVYTNGNSEDCIGKYFAANPNMRKKIFLATKGSGAHDAAGMEAKLQASMKKMNTDYIDVFYGVHGLSDASQLTDELKTWAENAKKKGVIKYFGFTTHGNMAKSLFESSKLGWVDAILTTYNFRLTKDPLMQKAIDACHKAGIVLTAMKTQKSVSVSSDEDKKLIEHFSAKGFSEGQAKIKAVMEDERITSVNVGMNSVGLINENVAAALDRTKMAQDDKDVLAQYASATCGGYCAGCSHICDSALGGVSHINDVMRSLMYHNSYGSTRLAKETFASIPSDVKARLLTADYRLAEQRCPQHMPIAKLVREAVEKLA